MKSRGRVARTVDRLLVGLHESHENLDYNVETNGERRLLERLSTAFGPDPMLFDVGANQGCWSLMAARIFPGATIHAFEIIPRTREILREATKHVAAIRCHDVGLSDYAGEMTVFLPEGESTVATSVEGFAERYHGLQTTPVAARVVTGDEFCAAAHVDRVDLLKIDVEGHEDRVLKGCRGLLATARVKVIQFEYGRINIDTHFLLKDFYEVLGGFGYTIGKIYPHHVDFRDYRHEHEDFLGPNYIAVHRSCARVLQVLAAPASQPLPPGGHALR